MRTGTVYLSLTFSSLDPPSCGLADTRSGRQFFLDQSGFDAREDVRRRRRARTRRLRNPAANRLSHHWNKSQSPGRLRKVSGATQPWLYQVRTGSRLACLGTAISAQFVLTTASCLVGRGEVQHLQQVSSRAVISLYRVVLHHQWSQGWDLALVQTKTSLQHFICLPSAPLHHQGATALQVGFKVSNLERKSEQPSLFYQNITFPAQHSSTPDLHKWVKIFGKKILHFVCWAGSRQSAGDSDQVWVRGPHGGYCEWEDLCWLQVLSSPKTGQS